MLNSDIYNAKVSKFYSSYSRNISTLHHRGNLVEWALKNSSSASYFPLKILKEIENQLRLKNFNLHLIFTCDLCTQAETRFWLFKRRIALSNGKTSIQPISIRATNCIIHWITLPTSEWPFEQLRPGQYYSQTGKTVNTRNISGMLLSCKRKADQAWEN